jgi:hypothetical protein
MREPRRVSDVPTGQLLVEGGFAWLFVSLYVVLENVILRETPLGIIARAIDRLPVAMATPVFMICWLVFLSGWLVPLALGARMLLGRRRLPSNYRS